MIIKLRNKILEVISSDNKEKKYKISDFIKVSLNNNYELSGTIKNLEEENMILEDNNASSETHISYSFIKNIT